MCDAVVDNRRRWQHLLMTTQSQTDHQQLDTAAAAAVMRSLYPPSGIHTSVSAQSTLTALDVARHHRRWNTGLTALDCTPHARLPLCTLSTVPRASRSHLQDVGYSVTTWCARHHQHRHDQQQQQQQQLGISRYQRLHHHLYLLPHSLTRSSAFLRKTELNSLTHDYIRIVYIVLHYNYSLLRLVSGLWPLLPNKLIG